MSTIVMEPPARTATRTVRASEIVNGVWRLDPPTDSSIDWTVTNLLTGWSGELLSRPHAMRYLARPESELCRMMRSTSQHALVNPRSTPADVRRARRVIEVLDGAAIPVLAGAVLEYGPDVPDMRCECGGYLVNIRGKVQHVDTCPDCFNGDRVLACESRDQHVMCMKPAAQVCEHHHCRSAGDLLAVPCESGKDTCCGCCHGDLDS